MDINIEITSVRFIALAQVIIANERQGAAGPELALPTKRGPRRIASTLCDS